ncbi:MAG: ABC transporter ATP-binding protein [Cyclobacteriaceae bacterium]
MEPVISVKNISKRYRIGLLEKYETFAEQAYNTLLYPLKNFKKISSLTRFTDDDDSVFWALRDINFDVQEGEVLGIIGPNGAGKSTLLKILSRITEPTSGEIKIIGRVSSLLEVGTGFHPELTGRDNIYMNGTILGMRKREIDSKFEEIVAFSGVEKHIDTPVKFYSSGMKVRLAFAVAAHLEPEILIIDEVLAVGDAEFQKKCLGKMKDISKRGRTVLFVSHNMGAVEALCNRGILLRKGMIETIDTVDQTISTYYQSLIDKKIIPLNERVDRTGDGSFRFLSVVFNEGLPVRTCSRLRIEIEYETFQKINNLHIAITFCKNLDDRLMVLDNLSQGFSLEAKIGRGRITLILENFRLLPYQYSINLWAAESKQVLDYILDAAILSVNESDIFGSGFNLNVGQHGHYAPEMCDWSCQKQS